MRFIRIAIIITLFTINLFAQEPDDIPVENMFDYSTLATWETSIPEGEVLPTQIESSSATFLWGAKSINGSYVYLSANLDLSDAEAWQASDYLNHTDPEQVALLEPDDQLLDLQNHIIDGNVYQSFIIHLVAPGSGYDLHTRKDVSTRYVKQYFPFVSKLNGQWTKVLLIANFRGPAEQESDFLDFSEFVSSFSKPQSIEFLDSADANTLVKLDRISFGSDEEEGDDGAMTSRESGTGNPANTKKTGDEEFILENLDAGTLSDGDISRLKSIAEEASDSPVSVIARKILSDFKAIKQKNQLKKIIDLAESEDNNKTSVILERWISHTIENNDRQAFVGALELISSSNLKLINLDPSLTKSIISGLEEFESIVVSDNPIVLRAFSLSDSSNETIINFLQSLDRELLNLNVIAEYRDRDGGFYYIRGNKNAEGTLAFTDNTIGILDQMRPGGEDYRLNELRSLLDIID